MSPRSSPAQALGASVLSTNGNRGGLDIRGPSKSSVSPLSGAGQADCRGPLCCALWVMMSKELVDRARGPWL